MLGAAIAALIASFFKSLSFGIVGEYVTYRMRLDVFNKILTHPKSWFDFPENQPANLISIISNDTQIINGVCT